MKTLKKESRLGNKPFKQVVNEAVRRGMSPRPGSRRSPKFKVVPNRSKLVTGIYPQKLNQLNDEMGTAEFAKRAKL